MRHSQKKFLFRSFVFELYFGSKKFNAILHVISQKKFPRSKKNETDIPCLTILVDIVFMALDSSCGFLSFASQFASLSSRVFISYRAQSILVYHLLRLSRKFVPFSTKLQVSIENVLLFGHRTVLFRFIFHISN